MLINAMEVSGIEGSFRITCEHVMRVLRENKDSLMAVLEAFVYDPLLNWRLMTNASPRLGAQTFLILVGSCSLLNLFDRVNFFLGFI
jgi:phosphatidylinositol kinase/protein kinase (PI-3  family)